ILGFGDPPSERVYYLRAAPEADAVLETHAVAVNHENAERLRVGAVDHLPVARVVVLRLSFGDAAERARRRAENRQSAVKCREVNRGWMPEVLADEQREPSEARLECAHAVAAREISLLVEHAVGRQIDFAMDVAHLAAIEVDRRIVKPVVRPFFDEAGNKGDVAAQFFKTVDLGCG